MIIGFVKQLENSKTDSILDLGLSKIEHREKFRDFAVLHNYEITKPYLNISKETPPYV